MENIKRFCATIVLIYFFAGLQSQAPEDIALPTDPAVLTGVLDNGMTYYVRSNSEPKERASFYMIQNVGAILEEDHQNGLAHYLEHMAFNGTKHFPGKGILNTLEKHGVAFGYNINAYTSQDQTVYNLSDVPTNVPGLIDTCLLVLNDWSNYLLLTGEEIEAERGVISEEWRTRRNADFRMYRASLPYVYNHSKYASRDVIGDLEVIQNFEHDALREFYQKWYRTDLQAIAVVGDFNAEEVEQKVIELFSKIPAVENPEERYSVLIPDNEEMIFGLVTDEEATQSEITIYMREYNPDQATDDINDLREDYIINLFNRMVSLRISELLQKGEPPFVRGSIARTSLKRNYDLTYFSVTAKTNEEALALSTILEEAERIKRHGFAPGELERAKLYSLNRMENRVKEKDKISNDRYAYKYQSHYLQGNTYMDIETEFQLMQQLFPTITTDDIEKRIPAWFELKNMVMVISGPESEDVKHLSEAEARAILEASTEKEVEPYEDVEVATSLINEPLAAGKITSEKKIDELDAIEWTLSNGAKVVYRFADYEKDNIGIRAYSKGGSSLYADELIPSLDMLATLVPFYGVADYDRVSLQKMLTGKTVSLNVELGSLSEGMRGSASPKDFETLMQLVYLNFTDPRFDDEAHQAIIGRYIAFIQNMNKNPQKIISDTLSMVMTNYHPRTRTMDEEYIEEVDLDIIEKVYKERFKDASDFTFFIVGNIQKDELQPFVEQYLASLPGNMGSENWVDHNMDEPEGKLLKEVKLDLQVPKSTVILAFMNETEYTPENMVYMDILQGILDLRFIESIREEEGGTYGVMANTSLAHYPDSKGSLLIMFDTDPQKASYLKELIYKELDQIAERGPLQKDLEKTALNMVKDRQENREHNAYWMNALQTYYIHGYNSDAATNFENIVKEATVEDIREFMKEFYVGANIIDMVFSPQEETESE